MKPVYTVLIAGASAIVGGVAGYFLCKKRMQDEVERKVAEAINEELSRIRMANSRKEEEKKAVEEEKEEKKPVDGRILNIPSSTDERHSIVKRMIREQFPDTGLNEYRLELISQRVALDVEDGMSETDIYNMIMETIEAWKDDDYPPEDDPEEDEEEEGDFDVIDETNEPQWAMTPWTNKPPEVISLQDYTALPPYFDFVTFHYFNEDDVLLDDQDCVVDDVDGTVGDALVCFGDKAAELSDGDDNAVYVVNGKLGLAIEICRYHGSYAAWEGWSV